MGNRCSKKKYKPLLKIEYENELKQIIIVKKGSCDICDKKDVEGMFAQSVMQNFSIFICKECKNLHNN